MDKNIQIILAFILGMIFILLPFLMFRGGMMMMPMMNEAQQGDMHDYMDDHEGDEHSHSEDPVSKSNDGGFSKISFDKTEYDFGKIPKADGIVFTNFVVRNTGESKLIINKITTSCGCTTAEISKKTIPPDGSAVLTVVFDPNFHDEPGGKFERIVFLETNDPDNPETQVIISVDITE